MVEVLNFDSLRLGMIGVPAFYIHFEDCRSEHVTAAAYMAAHGLRGTFSIVSDLVGTGGRASWAQLQTMEAAGHCIINATKDHTSLGGLSEAAQEAELTDCRDAGKANGIWSGTASENWRYMSYPGGSYNTDTLTAFNNVGMRLGWNMVGNNTMFGMPFGQVYQLPFTNLAIAKSLSDLLTFVDTSISQGMLFPCYIEDMGGASISLTTFYAMIDYIWSKRNQIVTVTSDDLYKLQSGTVRIPRVY
jgi:peptidoglycan/xylan/chitin deacetylase (PgdA/CDA1 family)